MEDSEIVRVAAFKLQESINRLQTLAKAAHRTRVRARLLALARQLTRHEAALRALTAPIGPTAPAPEPATVSTPLRERMKRVAAR